MLTHCPGCETVFRVTSAILRAAHGQVRCGRCNTQFDAIAHLLDQDEEAAAQRAEAEDAGVADHDVGADRGATEGVPHGNASDPHFPGIGHEDIIMEGHRIEISGVYAQPDGVLGSAHSEAIAEFNAVSQQWEDPFDARTADTDPDPAIDSESPSSDAADLATFEIDAPEEPDEPATVPPAPPAAEIDRDAEIDDIEQALDGVALAGEIASLETPATPRTTDLAAARPEPEPATALPDFLSAVAAPNTSTTSPWVWRVTALGAALLLGIQLLHHFRTELARHPSFGPLLINAYARVGIRLVPSWQLSAYTIKQWGIVSDPQQAATLRLRASITNTATFAQPYPLLRFSLEDRFGMVVGQRDFTPAEYLPGHQAGRRLASQGAANIDLAIVDPGAEAVGFQLDSCLPLTGGVVCTHDTPKH